MDDKKIELTFNRWCEKLRIKPEWSVKLVIIDDENNKRTGDLKIDCEDKKVVFIFNKSGNHADYLEETIVHELMHLKLYPLDQTTETLIDTNFEKGTKAYDFAYTNFMINLEKTVEELTKCFLFEFGNDKELSFGRCENNKSFNDLFEGLKNL